VKPKPVSHALPAATIPGAVLMLAVLGANQLTMAPGISSTRGCAERGSEAGAPLRLARALFQPCGRRPDQARLSTFQE